MKTKGEERTSGKVWSALHGLVLSHKIVQALERVDLALNAGVMEFMVGYSFAVDSIQGLPTVGWCFGDKWPRELVHFRKVALT